MVAQISTLPLIRVPCILVAAVGLHIAAIPPNPPPTEEERAPSTKLEALLGHRFLPLTVGTVCWGTALAEVAVVLANYAPSLPISKIVLSNLIFATGSAERIHASPLSLVGLFAITLGGWIRYKCYKALGAMFTFQMSIRKNHILITSGPYGVVRHPGYSGILLAVVGMLLFHGVKGSWIRESGALETKLLKGFTTAFLALTFIASFGVVQRMFKEDEILHQRCGEEWEKWARKVPYRLIPGLF